jgi:agmatinase
MLPRELLRAIRQIVGRVELAGMDIVEVAPPYDWAESTAQLANRCALEAISALAVRRRAGHDVRFARAAEAGATAAK